MSRIAVGLAAVLVCLVAAAPAPAATKIFANPTPLLDEFSDGAGALLPYPSAISASGLQGKLTTVMVTVQGIAFADTDELWLILAGPGGQTVVLLDKACSAQDSIGTPLSITFDDAAATPAPNSGTCSSGTYRPTDADGNTSDFGHPLPPRPYGTSLATVAAGPPNGSWQLYAKDTAVASGGSIIGGWILELTTTNPKKCKKPRGKRAARAKKRCKKPKKK